MAELVSVACKLPAGLVLQLFHMSEVDEPIMGGGVRVVRRASRIGERVRLHGFARKVKPGEDADDSHEIRSGAGITHGVDADFFAEWMRQNADSDVVRKGLVFAQAKPRELTAQARDHKSLKSGLEGIDVNNLPAEFKGKISTADIKA